MNLIFLLLLACGEVVTDNPGSLGSVDDIPTPSSEVNPEDVIEEDVQHNLEQPLHHLQVYLVDLSQEEMFFELSQNHPLHEPMLIRRQLPYPFYHICEEHPIYL